MSVVTKNVSKYVEKRGINLSKASRETGIPYGALYASLCDVERDRDLRDDEFVKLCAYLEVNPMDFADRTEEVV